MGPSGLPRGGGDGEVLRPGDTEVAEEKVDLTIGNSEAGLVVGVGRGEIKRAGDEKRMGGGGGCGEGVVDVFGGVAAVETRKRATGILGHGDSLC